MLFWNTPPTRARLEMVMTPHGGVPTDSIEARAFFFNRIQNQMESNGMESNRVRGSGPGWALAICGYPGKGPQDLEMCFGI